MDSHWNSLIIHWYSGGRPEMIISAFHRNSMNSYGIRYIQYIEYIEHIECIAPRTDGGGGSSVRVRAPGLALPCSRSTSPIPSSLSFPPPP